MILKPFAGLGLGIVLLVLGSVWPTSSPTSSNANVVDTSVVDANVRHISLDPYDEAILIRYKTYRDALLAGDFARLATLTTQDDFLAYRSSLTLARTASLSLEAKVAHYRRALALRIDDPLDKVDKRAFLIDYAHLAEEAGLSDEALRVYERALPEQEAILGVIRLQPDPYRRSNIFLKARLYEDAIEALEGRTAPSLEAPAYRAMRDYEEALDAYNRWLDEQPNNLDARYGRAWVNYYLGNYDLAEDLFAALPETSALRGRALIAWQRGEVDRAVSLLQESDDADHLWYATGYLEAKDRYKDAIPIYLRLARGSSIYADDAAYRAFVLASRSGEVGLAEEAKAYLPANSFFSLKLGRALEIAPHSTLETATPEVIGLADSLARVGDTEAATGELLFALRAASGAAERVAIAEHLQLLGEFRQSQRAGRNLLDSGVNDRRVWELAYPQAYAQTVGTEAMRNDLEPYLIWAIMRQESAFFPKAISRSNAQGLMQVIPSTWDWLAELQKEAPGDPFDIETNIRYGSFYLRWLLNYLEDDGELVIVSYNRGQGYIKRLFEGSVVQGDKDELYREIDALEAREYLQSVTVNYEIYKALYPSLSLRP